MAVSRTSIVNDMHVRTHRKLMLTSTDLAILRLVRGRCFLDTGAESLPIRAHENANAHLLRMISSSPSLPHTSGAIDFEHLSLSIPNGPRI